ncbi:MAG: M61 family metallopeptidase [Chitinophagales bacterium]
MRNFLLLAFVSVLWCGILQAKPTLEYALKMDEPHTHYVDVEMKLTDLEQDVVNIKMAVWTPGSYLVREFARKVEGFEAYVGGKRVDAPKINKNTWEISTGDATDLTVKYKVYSYEMTVRTSFVDERHAYLNNASVFMFAEGMQDLPATIRIKPYKDWKVMSTSLKPVDSRNKWVLSSPNYDILVDSPIEIGNHHVVDFDAEGIPHYLALIGEGNYDEGKLVDATQKIVTECKKVFGEHPCDGEDYTILNHSTGGAGGGLEHLNSTSLMWSRWNYSGSNLQRWMGLMCHEYFHLWNIKRMRPDVLGPFDYENENYTTLLWVAEGVTSYYDDYLLRRADLVDVKKYLSIAAGNINTYQNKPGRKVQSVAEASHDAWIKYYRQDENSKNCCVSYYTKGAVVSMLLDLEIMNSTKGEKNMDNVMQNVYGKYFKELDRGFTAEEFKAEVEAVAGKNLDQFWVDYIDGVADIDYNKYFGYAGLRLVNVNEDLNKQPLTLGARLSGSGGKLTVSSLKRGTCGYEGGINAKDELLSIDGYRTSSSGDVSTILANKKSGDVVEVMVSREKIIKTLKITLSKDETEKWMVEQLENPSRLQKSIYKKWLHADMEAE